MSTQDGQGVSFHIFHILGFIILSNITPQTRSSSAIAPPFEFPSACHVRVDPVFGSDDDDKKVPSVFKSPIAARDHVRNLTRPLESDVLICLAPGLYTQPLVLDDPFDGGGNTSQVIWQGFQTSSSSRTEFTSGVQITFTPPPPSSTIWTASLPSFGVTDYGQWQSHGFLQKNGCVASPLELFLQPPANATSFPGYALPMIVARWPNIHNPSDEFSHWTDEASWTRSQWEGSQYETQNGALFVENTERNPLGNWSVETLTNGNLFFHGYPFFDWADGSVNVTGYNSTSRLLSLTRDVLAYNLSFSAKFFLDNAFEALDAEGEYYVNSTTGVISFIPPAWWSDSKGATSSLIGWVSNATAITANNSQDPASMISVLGISHVTISNIAITYTRGGAILISNSNTINILNVSLIGAGTDGIVILESNATLVNGAIVAYMGGSGISSYGGGSRSNLISSEIVVTNSIVHHIGRRCLSYAGAITLDSIGAVISHNNISGTPHIGTNTGSNDGLFEYNIVSNTVLASCDMGAFYAGPNDWSVWNTTIRYNLFYLNGYSQTHCNKQSGTDVADIYFDECGSGVNIYGNVHWSPLSYYNFSYLTSQRNTYVHLINGGSHINVGNELIIDGNVSFYESIDCLDTSSYGGTGGYFAESCSPTSSKIMGMKNMDWNTSMEWVEQYPDLAKMQASCDEINATACALDPTCPAAPYFVSFTNNVHVNVTGTIIKLGHNSSTFNPDNFNFSFQWEGLDPGFAVGSPMEAREEISFQLSNTSEVYKVLSGFKRIPMECFGPWKTC